MIMGEKLAVIPTWQTVDNVSWSFGTCVRHGANFGRPCWWYSLWMRIKGPHNYTVTAIGSCAKWSLFFLFFISFHKLRILGSCNNNAHNPRSPMWVLLGSFFMSSKLMPGRFTRQILWCISKSKSKHQHKLDFPWSTYGVHKCTFVDSLDEYTGSSNHIYSLSNVE